MRSPFWLKLYDDSWGVKLPHDTAVPGDIVAVTRKDGTTADVRLVERLSGDQHWSIWRVSTELVSPAPAPKRAQPRRPLLRRAGTTHRLPVMTPEPPPHDDKDAPPPEDD